MAGKFNQVKLCHSPFQLSVAVGRKERFYQQRDFSAK